VVLTQTLDGRPLGGRQGTAHGGVQKLLHQGNLLGYPEVFALNDIVVSLDEPRKL